MLYGTLTIDNLESYAKAIEEKLTGKKYVFVAYNEIFGFEPEVRTGQELKENSLRYWKDEENNPPHYAGFNFTDSYGVWGLSTSQKENKYDPTFNAPHVVIEHNHIIMTLLAPAGQKIYWHIAIQED
jgi:hypothetical protein